jgi:signal transduction histidine kinase
MTPEGSPAWPASRAAFWGGVAVFAAVAALGCGLGRLQPSRPPLLLTVAAAAVATGAAAMLLRRQPPTLLRPPMLLRRPSLLRRRPPMLVYAVIAAAGIVVIGDAAPANPVWFALLLVGGWCSLEGGRLTGGVFWAGSMVLFVIQWTWIRPDPSLGAWLAGGTATFLGGLLIRHQLGLVAQLRAAQAGLATKARAEERNRIARDLHDVIAHTLTVSLLHVMSARLAVEHDPDDALRSLAEAERLGRESLDEVRAVVGMLRADGDVGRTGPLPGVAALPELVERFQSAGAEVALSVDGDIARLPATVGLAIYRILQEALTNVIKHAPGSRATARLNVDASAVTLTVHSTGAPGAGEGLGVIGMRERAESLGGHCEAGPAERGWQVRATFPLTRPSQEIV